MVQLTYEEMIELYGDAKVKFFSYNKYKFTYETELPNGDSMFVTCGGDLDTVYRHEVYVDEEHTPLTLNPIHVEVYNKEGTVHEYIKQ